MPAVDEQFGRHRRPASENLQGTNPLTRERAAREGGASGGDGVTRWDRVTGRASRLEDQGVNNLHLSPLRRRMIEDMRSVRKSDDQSGSRYIHWQEFA